MAASLALLLTACASLTPPLTPEQQQDALIQQLYRELAAGNFEACMGLVSRQSISDVEMEAFLGKVRHMLAGAKGKIDARGGLQHVEIVQRDTAARPRVGQGALRRRRQPPRTPGPDPGPRHMEAAHLKAAHHTTR